MTSGANPTIVVALCKPQGTLHKIVLCVYIESTWQAQIYYIAFENSSRFVHIAIIVLLHFYLASTFLKQCGIISYFTNRYIV
jgi:hypothetical protein